MDRMVNYIRLACMLKTYRTCNSTIRFSKYEFNNKLLSSVILLLSVTLRHLLCKNVFLFWKGPLDIGVGYVIDLFFGFFGFEF